MDLPTLVPSISEFPGGDTCCPENDRLPGHLTRQFSCLVGVQDVQLVLSHRLGDVPALSLDSRNSGRALASWVGQH